MSVLNKKNDHSETTLKDDFKKKTEIQKKEDIYKFLLGLGIISMTLYI